MPMSHGWLAEILATPGDSLSTMLTTWSHSRAYHPDPWAEGLAD